MVRTSSSVCATVAPDLAELLARLLVLLRQRAQQRAVLDHEQVLTKAVVQLRGDPLTLAFLRFDQLRAKTPVARPARARIWAMRYRQDSHTTATRLDADRGTEPPGLVEARQDHDSERLSGRVPHAFAIVGGDVEGVGAWWKMRIVRRPTRAGVHPVAIESGRAGI